MPSIERLQAGRIRGDMLHAATTLYAHDRAKNKSPLLLSPQFSLLFSVTVPKFLHLIDRIDINLIIRPAILLFLVGTRDVEGFGMLGEVLVMIAATMEAFAQKRKKKWPLHTTHVGTNRISLTSWLAKDDWLEGTSKKPKCFCS